MNSFSVSVIIPCYRSEMYLEKTVRELLTVFSLSGIASVRVILVNDASPDGTFGVIRRLADLFPGVVSGIDLMSNVGQSRAKMAALPFTGDGITVFMDDDGQHDPRSVVLMAEKIREGNDLVYARFPELKETLPRRAASRVLDLLLRLFAGKPAGIRITSYFALSGRARTNLLSYQSLHPFIGGRLMSSGFRVCSVPSEHRARRTGRSGYSLKKLTSRAIEMCFLFRLPLKSGDPPMYEIRETTGLPYRR